MESEKKQAETILSATAPTPAITSCRKKKKEDATFLEDVKEHINEFVNASMDEHKSCFTKTIQKMFGMSKVVAKRSSEGQEVESVLPLETTIAK
ncbi:hypothetical protein BVRB_9g217410 [Beta vulgaris subsp. vulgaris]|uniref:uncharacterized protein LOC104904350 n=1 Tax=Beta vulgaris subsp. vulgaris TaxID=3555 RepID=UPI000540152D|nr:uncharacterized protein LOC104904350 [Beta vulgaris subsp. vulgaris]XP_010690874.1 uncharacterized protein LOC104904350 [Beta vulgaris subsp. vulgaris]XP_010690875.1 uncharacterized protein LOC104904350 [Beta vulgaris subsp. vulgaris]KMT00439.1 hypothetical protein BVRB_9g217410 [Beta vulgaris subsp. vulgaris]